MIETGVVLVIAAASGCGDVSKLVNPSWHQKFGWKAEDYFADAK
jgi:hypothetical protein